MEKEFIPYEQALALKELGFDEPCFGYYNNLGSQQFILSLRNLKEDNNDSIDYFSAPLYQQAFRWFREKYNIDGFIRIEPLNEKYGFVIYNREKDNFKEFSTDYTKTEDAEFECLIKLIEIVKQPKKD